MMLYFTALDREVTKAGKSCKESYFLLYLSLKLALLNLFGPNLGYLLDHKKINKTVLLIKLKILYIFQYLEC